MKQFSGFPARMEFTPLPNVFFSSLLPQIDNINELRTTLYIFQLLYQKRGYPRFTTYGELAHNPGLMGNLKDEGKSADEVLRDVLGMAVKRGIILHIALQKDGVSEDVYLLNTEAERQVMEQIKNGELNLPGLKAKEQMPESKTEPQPNIFTLYEENIGMLTPMIADELREAEKLYPGDWISDAIKEAVSLNKRNWRYIARILENWSTKGRGDEKHKRDPGRTDPNKYVKGKYGRTVRR